MDKGRGYGLQVQVDVQGRHLLGTSRQLSSLPGVA